MTYKDYLKKPISVLEGKLNEKLAKNPELERAFDKKLSHPFIRKYSAVD